MGRRKKSILSIFLMVFLLASLMACSKVKKNEKTPEQTVIAVLDAIKVGEVSEASIYMDYDKLVKKSSTKDVEKNSAQVYFANLEYEVLSSSEEADKATVVAKITNTDMNLLMDEVFETVMKTMANAPIETQEEVDRLLLQIYTDFLMRKDNKIITKTVEIPLYYENEGWKIDLMGDFVNAIFGGMLEASVGLNMEE